MRDSISTGAFRCSLVRVRKQNERGERARPGKTGTKAAFRRDAKEGACMRAAVAVWQGRISPVFDVSRRILVLDVEGRVIHGRREEDLAEQEPFRKAGRLRDLNIDTLICGAISRPMFQLLASFGIRVIPFTAGETEEVIRAWLEGALPSPRFAMPGFRCRGLGGGGGSEGAWYAFPKRDKPCDSWAGRRCGRRGRGGWRRKDSFD